MKYQEQRRKELERHLEQWGIEHFSAEELVKTPSWDKCDRYYPPSGMVPNIKDTIKLADEIREKWGGPIICLSGYRPPLYNDHIEGSEDSQHMRFMALDLKSPEVDEDSFEDFLEVCDDVIGEYRENNVAGYGKYFSGHGLFIHCDTGRYNRNRNWVRRG